jgi:AraC-like DNA-binding protein
MSSLNNGEARIGFKQEMLREGELYHTQHKDYNQIFFLLEGKIIVNSSEGLGKIVNAGEFFFLPASADMSCQVLAPVAHFVLLLFDRLQGACDRVFFRDLWQLAYHQKPDFRATVMRSPIDRFLIDLMSTFSPLLEIPAYQQVKYEEALYLLRALYSKEEMARIFHPIIGRSIDFRYFVMANYLKVKNITELVRLSGLKRKTFDRQFNDEFEIPPYQWVLQQKAKHIRYALSETNDQMQDLMRKYGFTIAPHFTRFCKDYFDYTPLELRKRLRMEKSQLL